MAMISRATLALITLSALAIAACGDDADAPDAEGTLPAVGAAPTPAELSGRSFASTEVTGHELVAGSTIEMFFDADRVSIRAGCNSMNGGYRVTDGVLQTPGPMASTMMACDEPLMDQDLWVAAFLADGARVTLEGDALTLTGAAATITLAEVADTPLVGTTWTVTGVVAGEAVSSIPADAVASMTIAEDGTVAVETGCNTGSGSVEVGATTLNFGPIATTKRACIDEAVSDLEASVLAALQGEVTWEISGDSLSIRSGEGAGAVGLEFAGG
jgi:heat shock protein HslJ